MKKTLLQHLQYALKGMGMGAANVIPGVSGGTVALITGVFERIINAIKSFDGKAIQLLFKGKIKDLFDYVDFYFLLALGSGMVISIVSLARVLKYLFAAYPIYIWAFFFGLILASVYYVGKTIEKWRLSVIITFAIGAAIAVWISFMNPATQNDSFGYVVICGVVAVCSMILPGLSGSFVLILMGNYELVMIDAVSQGNISVLAPVVLGGIIGIIALSHVLSWVYKKFKDQTIALLTGFILGSLSILWPWKNEIYRVDELGNFLLKEGNRIVQGYDLFIPESLNLEVIIALLLAVVGFIVIALMEKYAGSQKGA
ncbi:MAG: DUF368 domain-containing protein [Tenuifilaceae bacterium]|jgi:putative membrane protein|nr:DUF368 domain-containing protein [Tenuifilaceae bacterium]